MLQAPGLVQVETVQAGIPQAAVPVAVSNLPGVQVWIPQVVLPGVCAEVQVLPALTAQAARLIAQPEPPVWLAASVAQVEVWIPASLPRLFGHSSVKQPGLWPVRLRLPHQQLSRRWNRLGPGC